METEDERILAAARHTEILRAPKQSLYTFGITNIFYYLVTEPTYSDLFAGKSSITETVIREGRVTAQRPKLVTPYYLSQLEGFSAEARRYFEAALEKYSASSAGLLYTYNNEPKETNIVSGSLLTVVDKLNAEIDQHGDPMTAIIKGEDELWDISILKFIFELTTSSLPDNIGQMRSRGLLNMDSSGIPSDARNRINELFEMVHRGELEPRELKDELDRWGVFEEYQDRFLHLFRKRR